MQTHQTAENSPRFPRGEISKKNSCSRSAEVEGGDRIECSGKHCGSCAAGLIADCVAICCCPCGLVNIFVFAFVKVPWMVGRKCVAKVKRRKKKLKAVDHDRTAEDEGGGGGDGNVGKVRVEDGILFEIVGEMGGFEAEKVWLELYKDGHLGFGRVSFTGISIQ